MASCLLCSVPASVGVLCTQHAVALASPNLTSEQLVSNIKPPGGASLVDAFGYPYPLEPGMTIGRERECGLAIAHASVSAKHATVTAEGGQWSIADSGSRNGTEVAGQRITGPTRMAPGAIIRIGEIGLCFWPEALATGDAPKGKGRTGPSRQDNLVFNTQVVTPRGNRLELRQRIDGGVARAGEVTLELAALEFGLLQLLVERRRLFADPDFTFVAWHEIADALAFKSAFVDSENVRELVHRVRRKLAGAGADDLIESRRGLGYRLAGTAT